jgi:hypothetical protein
MANAGPDLRKLKPSELVRLLNSTELGRVCDDKHIGFHRNEAGYRIGDTKTVDLVRYLGWLIVRKHSERRNKLTEAEAYEKNKRRAEIRGREISQSGRDIAPIPQVVNPSRKEACRLDFRLFCETYYPQTFFLDWSEDHLKVIDQVQTSVLEGGLFATAMPRGSGKTTLAETACQWAILYGHRRFVPLIGSDENNALGMLNSIKTEFETNELLNEDFPEAIYPIRCLDGIAIRAKGQLLDGHRTHIEWTGDRITMPTVPESKASGAVIVVCGITGGLRGMKVKRSDGETMRPDLILIDDPQTDQSARSPSQCETRERILKGAILGMAGPGRKIAGLMPCTVIADDDMADRFLDRDKHPEWNGTRTQMIYEFPTNTKLWDEYARMRADSMRAEHGGRESTEFYRDNREEMDAGAKVAWEQRHDPDELSGLQHAMNLRFDRGEDAFWAEYQNRPRKPDTAREDDLTPDKVCSRINRYPRRLVPISCNHVTAFIDVQATLLFYVAVAWEDNFTGYIVDYGSFPDQKTPYFTLSDAKTKLSNRVEQTTLEGQITEGLKRLTYGLMSQDWERIDGARMKIERCLIDANWGTSTDLIYKFCYESPYSALLTPSHGKYVGASSMPMREYSTKPGDKVGLNWIIPNVQGKRAVRHVTYDTNYWKSFIHSRFNVPVGDPGALTLFGDDPEQHTMFADHICAEYRVRTQGRGREVDEFKIRPQRPDNHFLDCLTGNAVAASIQGVVTPETYDARKGDKNTRVSFAELQRRARERPRGSQPTA